MRFSEAQSWRQFSHPPSLCTAPARMVWIHGEYAHRSLSLLQAKLRLFATARDSRADWG